MVSIKMLQVILYNLFVGLKLYEDCKNNVKECITKELYDQIKNIDQWTYAVTHMRNMNFITLGYIDEDDDHQNNLEKVNDEIRSEDVQLKNDLKIFVRFFKKKRNYTRTVDKCKTNESKFMTLLNFTLASANYNHFYHNGFNFSTMTDMRNKYKNEMVKLMMSNTYYTIRKTDNITFELISLLLIYSTMFPTLENNENYTDCYFDNLLGFGIQTKKIFHFDLPKFEKVEILLTNFTTIQLTDLLPCMLLEPEIKKYVEQKFTLKRFFENITKTPFDKLYEKKNKLFKHHLALAIAYFKKALKLDDCNKFPKYENSKKEFNFQKIVDLLTRSAMENYYLHKNYRLVLLHKNKSIEMKKLMPSKCVPGLNENKETFQSLHEFLDLLKLFSSENVYGKKRYLKNILELKLINEKIEEFVAKKNNVSRETLNISIKKGIQNFGNCLTPKAI